MIDTSIGAVKLWDNRDVIVELSRGNPGAAIALANLLDHIDGARALRRYFEVEEWKPLNLTSEELWIIYKVCDEDAKKFAMTLNIIHDLDPSMVYANLRLVQPAKFIEEAVTLPGFGPKRYNMIRTISENFSKNYKIAKARQ